MTEGDEEPLAHALTFRNVPEGYGRCLRCDQLLNALTIFVTPCGISEREEAEHEQ